MGAPSPSIGPGDQDAEIGALPSAPHFVRPARWAYPRDERTLPLICRRCAGLRAWTGGCGARSRRRPAVDLARGSAGASRLRVPAGRRAGGRARVARSGGARLPPPDFRAAQPGAGELAWSRLEGVLRLDGNPDSGGPDGLPLLQSLLALIAAYERWVEAREGREGRIEAGAVGRPDRRPDERARRDAAAPAAPPTPSTRRGSRPAPEPTPLWGCRGRSSARDDMDGWPAPRPRARAV